MPRRKPSYSIFARSGDDTWKETEEADLPTKKAAIESMYGLPAGEYLIANCEVVTVTLSTVTVAKVNRTV